MNVKLVMAKGQARGHTIQLREPQSIIGRQRECQVRIPSADVSRRHCRLTFEEGYLYAEDLGSTNGTFINGEKIQGREIVQPGDILEVGPVTFTVKYEAPQRAADELGVIQVLDDLTESDVLATDDAADTETAIPLEDVELVDDVEELEVVEDAEQIEVLDEAPSAGQANADFNVEEQSLNLPQDRDFRDLLSGLDGK